MSHIEQSSVQNTLLRSMNEGDFALVGPHLEATRAETHQALIAPHEAFGQMFFPESGFASVTTTEPSKIEVGIIGREGLVGVAALMGDDQTPYEHYVQAPGEVLGISTVRLLQGFEQSRTLRTLLLRYVHTLLIQTAQTAFVNATFDVETRLARWLLMSQDRLGGTEVALTHEFLSIMLGVRRSSVTLSLQVLEGTGLIRARRGRIEIRNREQMIVVADGGYGVPEAAYDRLIGA
jgi:CRP-like cAMP-binding protein